VTRQPSLRVIGLKFRPIFYKFQEKLGCKVAISSEQDKMFAMDLRPRSDKGVEAYVRSFEPNQVGLFTHVYRISVTPMNGWANP
jgi:hypothetical protein